MKTGFVTLLGRPNAGKSTLLNAILSKKVSIVSPKSQTTRDDILGIYNEKDLQIVFCDTPGLFLGEEAIYKTMYKQARCSLSDVDAVCYLIDSYSTDFESDDSFLRSIKNETPRFLLLNKIDECDVTRMEEVKKHFKESAPNWEIIEISALKNFGLKDLKNRLKEVLPEGLPFYPSEVITDKDRPFMAKEVLRESLLHFLKEEVPHDSATIIKSYKENKDGSIEIEARIIVSKESQKGIVIGKGGEMIKKISMRTRKELQSMWHTYVSLYANVEVIENWRDDPKKLLKLGYGSNKKDL